MHRSYPFARPIRFILACMALLTMLSLTGCISMYVDPALKDVKPEQLTKVASPKPVQFLFEFQTKGAANPRATEHVKKQVTELVQGSGLFSKVSDQTAPNGALLSIVINNIPLTEDAASKGFAAGFTLGLAGSMVTDGYICTVDYVPAAGSPRISRQVKHALHTSVGSYTPPKEYIKMDSPQLAVQTMVRQIVMNGLKEVSSDPSFK